MILYYFVEFAGSFANIALLLLFIGRLFPKKEPVSKWFYVYVVLMIAGQCALSLFPDWVTQRTIYLLVGGFFLALLFYEVRPWQAVFASGAFFTLIALVEVLAMLLIGLRIPDTDILMQAGAARLVYVVFSNLIQVPLVVLISHFFSRKGNALRILWLLPIIAIQIASIAVCYVAQYHAADEYFPDYMVGLMAVLLLINILIVFYVEALRENELEKFKAKFNEQQYNLQMEYYQQLKERQEEVRSLRHDFVKERDAMTQPKSDLAYLRSEKAKAEQQLRYYKHREKILEHQIPELTRKARVHRLCTRAGMLESFLIAPEELTNDQVMELLKIAFRQPEVALALAKMMPNFLRCNRAAQSCAASWKLCSLT